MAESFRSKALWGTHSTNDGKEEGLAGVTAVRRQVDWRRRRGGAGRDFWCERKGNSTEKTRKGTQRKERMVTDTSHWPRSTRDMKERSLALKARVGLRIPGASRGRPGVRKERSERGTKSRSFKDLTGVAPRDRSICSELTGVRAMLRPERYQDRRKNVKSGETSQIIP